jgi:hypothetical protein
MVVHMVALVMEGSETGEQVKQHCSKALET